MNTSTSDDQVGARWRSRRRGAAVAAVMLALSAPAAIALADETDTVAAQLSVAIGDSTAVSEAGRFAARTGSAAADVEPDGDLTDEMTEALLEALSPTEARR